MQVRSAATLIFSLVILTACQKTETPPTAPTRSAGDVGNRTTERRAVEAAIWGMPIVAMDAVHQGFLRDLKANDNDIVFYSNLPDWKFQTTTPNASTHYIYSAFNLKRDGPVVLEVPAVVGAGLYGQLCDMWDVPLAIVGPGGEDKGKGGKYLFVSSEYSGKIPTGYIPIRLQTIDGFWLMRAIPKSAAPEDQAVAVALLKKIRQYPLSKAANPPEQRFIDASGKLWEGIPRMDESFYAVLAKMVNDEPVLSRDLAMMNMLRSIGIEKGKPFSSDASTTAVLKNAVQEAKAWLIDRIQNQLHPYWEGGHWCLPDTSGVKTMFSYESSDMLDYDNRGMLGFYGWAPPMKADASAPTIYLQSFRDNNNDELTGDKNYRLHVSPRVPAKQYWSATVYDYDTAGFIREAQVISLDSYNEKTRKNADGSVDIYFASQAPSGQEDNWVSTAKGRKWFAIFRLYGPDKPFFDKTWKLSDFEVVN